MNEVEVCDVGDGGALLTCEVLKRQMQELKVSLLGSMRTEFRSIVEEICKQDGLRTLASGAAPTSWQAPKAHEAVMITSWPEEHDGATCISRLSHVPLVTHENMDQDGAHIAVKPVDTDDCLVVHTASAPATIPHCDDEQIPRDSNSRISSKQLPTAFTSAGVQRTLFSETQRKSGSGKARNWAFTQSIRSSRKAVSRASSSSSITQNKSPKLSFSSFSSHLTFANFGECGVALAIVVNGICFGVQTDYMARNEVEDVPLYFALLEWIFCVIFSCELVVKLYIYRWSFYFGPLWRWNVFDTCLVTIQLLDVCLESLIATSGSDALENVSYLRLLRILRVLRIMRLVRLMKFFGDLNIVTQAIASSLRTLCGTLMLMALMMYIMGIAFTLFATTRRLEGEDRDGNLKIWFGSLLRTCLSLYESILGGADWDNCVTPLLDIHWALGVMFCMYIAFALLAMLNVVTGIFVESALKNAAKETERTFVDQVRAIYALSDVNHDGMISREEFDIEICDPEFQDYMKSIGIEPKEAKLLFDFLDSNHAGEIDCEQLLSGMLRLRSGAKCIDIMSLMHDFSEHTAAFDRWAKSVERILGIRKEPGVSKPFINREPPSQKAVAGIEPAAIDTLPGSLNHPSSFDANKCTTTTSTVS